jgi:hypothetical protein
LIACELSVSSTYGLPGVRPTFGGDASFRKEALGVAVSLLQDNAISYDAYLVSRLAQRGLLRNRTRFWWVEKTDLSQKAPTTLNTAIRLSKPRFLINLI